ncbi:unnamed protein product [Durusdinium trenchii]|uniref:Uncharacterized protein n=1 Tax=Durusdinium trenchii TaxID=1381693 RepID=A0ABP0IH21_9DINO
MVEAGSSVRELKQFLSAEGHLEIERLVLEFYKEQKGQALPLGPPIGREVYVSNLRSRDGRQRVPKLTILDSSGKSWMTLSKEDFEYIMKRKDDINKELIRYEKRLD